MALHGRACLALWNDIVRAREPEYDRWHTLEHVPERAAVSGFHGARRYVNRARDRHRYFTLYDVADLAVFAHAEYADLVAHPTPWSASMRPDFRNFLRAACTVRASTGSGIGAALAVLCLDGDRGIDAGTTSDLMAEPGVTACHLAEGAGDAAAASWSGVSAAAPPVRRFDRVLMIEALDRPAAGAALVAARRMAGLESLPEDFGNDAYDLAFVFPGHDASERTRHRRAGWDAP